MPTMLHAVLPYASANDRVKKYNHKKSLEIPKAVIRSRKSKTERQCNGKEEKVQNYKK